jgi:hypothetical protein
MLAAHAVAVVAEGLSDQNARDYGPRLGQDAGKGAALPSPKRLMQAANGRANRLQGGTTCAT